MKRMLLSIALALLGWVYAAPYLAISSLKQAALQGNTEALKNAVDFPALRASVKEELGGQISRQTASAARGGNGFAALGSALVGGFVNLMIDQLVTPQGIASIVQGKRADGTPDELAGTIERFGAKPQAGAGEPDADISEGYESLDRFSLRILPPKSKAPIALVWIRSGLTNWRLSGIRLPDLDELAKDSDEGNTMPSHRGERPETPRVRTAAAAGVSIPFFLGFIAGQPVSDAVNHAAALGFMQAGDCTRRQDAPEYTDCKLAANGGEAMEVSFFASRLQRIEYNFSASRYDEILGEITEVHGAARTLHDPHDPSFEMGKEWGGFQERFSVSLGKTADGNGAFATAVFDSPELFKADQ